MRPDNIANDELVSNDSKDQNPGPPKKAPRPKSAKPRMTSPGNANDNNVGHVLRSVYQKAIDEAIPAEMLDLLSKLD
ncbi:hypothetical protein BH10PSE12_BH10PSE12_08780 [soil metagenome]